MKLFAYCRGSDEGIKEYSLQRGASLIDTIKDGEGSYSGYRWLQNLIKRGECDSVLIPSLDHLGEDRYIALENKLFMNRNGICLICMNRPVKFASIVDRRRPIVTQAARLFSYLPEWDEEYGRSMPRRNTDDFKRKPPFGYKVVSGRVEIEEAEAELVNFVFDEFIRGASLRGIYHTLNERLPEREQPFGNMTVKTLLSNERYLGLQSSKGYYLPPIIRYDKWLEARERFEGLYGNGKAYLRFCLDLIKSDRAFVCIRNGFKITAFPGGGYVIDSERLEARLAEAIRTLASYENAEALFADYVLKEAAEAEKALPAAAEASNRAVREFRSLLERLICGERDAETQARLEELTDIKTVYGMRLRRIRSEQKLFSATKQSICGFFERCRRLPVVSAEEKRFICEAFVRSIRITDGRAFAYLNSPASPKVKKLEVTEVLI